MRKMFYFIFLTVFSIILSQCASYTINVATVPPKKVEIYVNDQYKATTNEDGTTSFKIENVSFEEIQLIEAKAEEFYGYVNVSYGKGIQPERQNVSLVINRNPAVAKKKAKMRYDIVFIVPNGDDSGKLAEIENVAASGDELSYIDESELDQKFDQCCYLATNKEKDEFKKATFEDKKIAWKNFWDKRDLDKSTAINEFKIQYFERVRIANKEYALQMKQGWETDRGRIYILYGEPDEVEFFAEQIDSKAHEIWHYYGLQGGLEFVFVSLRGGQDKGLVHSNARGELFDSNWERWLK